MRLPVSWTVKDGRLHGQMADVPGNAEVLRELNGWHWRDEFFSLSDGDIDGLVTFLNCVGAWPGRGEPDPNTPGHALRFPLVVQPEDVWSFREDLKDALANQQRFKEIISPAQSKPKAWFELFAHSQANSFELRFQLSDVAAGVVPITNARHMLFATVLSDISRGIRFKTCKRKGCRIPFAITSKHKRDYHTRECGHLALVQRQRDRERKKHSK